MLSHRFVRRVAVAVTALGATAGVASAASAQGGRHGAPRSRDARTAASTTLSVPGNQTWTDTGISLTVGEKVTISASGQIYPGSGTLPNGPVGLTFGQSPEAGGNYTNSCGLDQYVLTPPPSPGVNCFALLFTIGDTGVGFPTGKTISFRSPVQGELELGINDGDTSDNSGSFTAKITTS